MTTTTAANAPHQHTPAFSRLTRFGTFGFRGARPGPGPSTSAARQAEYYQSDANEDSDWVIPYHGPLEPPPDTLVGVRGDRDSWAGQVITDSENDGLERVRSGGSAMGHAGGVSTSGHGHGHGYSSSQDHVYGSDRMSRIDERARNRGVSPLSNYSVSVSTFGAGGAGSGGSERRISNALGSPTLSPVSARRAPVPSFLQLDIGGGVGMSPVPTQRIGLTSVPGHAHDGIDRERSAGHGYGHGQPPTAVSPVLSPRESLTSLWTFGRPGSKKSPPVHASSSTPGGPRPSSETHFSKQSVSSRQTGPAPTGPRDNLGMRERSATVTDPTQIARAHRPRSNTAAVMLNSASANGLEGSGFAPSPAILPHNNLPPTVIEPDTASSNDSYHRHPYASALPPTGHRQNSQLMQPSFSHTESRNQPLPPPPTKRHTPPTLSVPFLSPSKSINSLKRSAKNLKASVSTPNLRSPSDARKRVANNSASSADAAPSTPSATGSNGTSGTKWLSAETWCDALLFPRPRFRLRGAAHVISPPMSPTEFAHNPPLSPPAPAMRTRKRSLLGIDLRGKHGRAAPSAPPEVPEKTLPSYAVHPPPREPPQDGPSKPIERPPRPKSFAQDDLAIPSPVPSLATVLKQNAAFDKEREQWKEKAARSIGNKRSRSLSRSRAKVRLKQIQDQDHDELATSFGVLAASAFTGNQTFRPTIHFAPNTSASRSGGNTTGTSTAFSGLNSTSSHSRNVSASSQGGQVSGHSNGHGRKGSWSQTAINAAKSTANATGLCNFNQDLSPADEKVMILDPSLARVRSKFSNPNVHPQIREPELELGEDVIIISPQKEEESGLRRIPSHLSYNSEAQSGVGIAVSTPTALVDSSYRHPFTSGITQSDSIPRGSDYAGPHPSKKVEHTSNDTVGDAKFSRRLAVTTERPTSTSLHPYSAYEGRPGRRAIRIPSQSISPTHKMFAEVSPNGIREVYPDEIQYSPYSSRHIGNSSRNSEALGVEEALAAVLSSRSDSQTTEDDMNMNPTPADDLRIEPGVQELILPPLARTGSYRGLLMPQIEELRESWQTHPGADVSASVERGSPPPAYPHQGQDSITPNSTFRGGLAKASPGMVSIDSSPMTSPRQFKQFDDMEDYSDIFYKAPDPNAAINHSGGGNSNGSSERRTPLRMTTNESNESTWSSDRPVLSRDNSALTTLKRQLSQKYVQNVAAERQILGEDTIFSNHVSDVTEERESNLGEAHAIVSQASSPPGTTLPLRPAVARPESSGPTILIPEDVDVESSRASSILERYDGDDGTDVIYRVKEVPSQSTPPINRPELVSESRHGSYIDSSFNPSVIGGHVPSSSPPTSQNVFEMRMRPSMSSQSGSLKPPSAARASYLTSTSSSSRISESQLSNFPAPPTGRNSLTPGTIIQSYFGSRTPDDDENERDAMVARETRPHRIHFPVGEEEEEFVTATEGEQLRQSRASRRTTFGTFEASEPF